ncbi:MAG: SPOR domain-containing protein [Alphaproteobacteria bacterium]|nr:SPOR domain-containing protein [Alphaproteobacteria bacterium]
MRLRKDPLADELAALDELDDEVRRPAPKRGALLLPILVMMIVTTGAATIAWYSYTTGLKEGSEGAAPLLKPDGPTKVAPVSPGGQAIPHREKTAFNMIDGRNSDRTVERLLPPPEIPRNPPVAAKPDTANSQMRSADRQQPSALAQDGGNSLGRPATGGPVQLAPRQIPPKVIPKAVPKSLTRTPPEASKGRSKWIELPPLTSEEPAVTAKVPKPTKLSPSSGGDGSYRVQIGSVSSEAQARRLWKQQSEKNGDLLGALSLNIQQVTIKGRTYHRVQGGPLSGRNSARGLCNELKKRQTGCIIVRPKK